MCDRVAYNEPFTYRYRGTIISQRLIIIDHKLSVDDVRRILDSGDWTFGKKYMFFHKGQVFALKSIPLFLECSIGERIKIGIQNVLASIFVLRDHRY